MRPKGCGTLTANPKLNVVNMKLRFTGLTRKIYRAFNVIFLFCFMGGALYLVQNFSPSESNSLSGHASVSDGDSLRMGGERIRILGIDAPELDQTCRNMTGEIWQCGRQSKARMSDLVRGGKLQCHSQNRDKYGRALAVCEVDGEDIGAIMVMEGLAVSYNDYPREEALAHASKRGLWQGDFIRPRTWRDGVRLGGEEKGAFQWLWDWFAGN